MVTEPRILRRWVPTDLRVMLANAVSTVRAPTPPWRAGTAQRTGIAHRAGPGHREPRFSLRYADVLLPAAVTLWALGLSETDTRTLGLYGLVTLLPPTYYAGIVLLVVSAAVELGRHRPSSWRMAVHTFALTFMLYATAPIVYATGRYSWLYKTVGVVQYVNAHGKLNGSIDIYQDWSGFFALAAWFGKVAGVSSALSYAKWSQLVVELAALPLLYLIYDGLSLTPRQRWVALLLYPASNWIAQDYFSPQSLGTLLSLGVMAMAIRWLSLGRHLDGRWRDRDPVAAGTAPGAAVRLSVFLRRPRFVIFALCLIYFVLTFTHEISPYIVAIQLGVLALVGLLRPRWLPLLLAAIAIGFLLPHFTFVNDKYKLLQGVGDFFGNVAPPSASSGSVSSATQLIERSAELLSVGMWGLAAVGAWLRRGQRRIVLGLILLTCSPVVVLIFQAYGQEGILRVYLFSLPWCAALAALALVPSTSVAAVRGTSIGHDAAFTSRTGGMFRKVRGTVRGVVWSVTRALRLPADWSVDLALRLPAGRLPPGALQVPLVLLVVLALFFPAFFGDDGFNTYSAAEVATIASFERTATPGPVYPAIDNVPFNDTFRYNLFPKVGIFGNGSMLGSYRVTSDIADLVAEVAADQAGPNKPAYVIIAPSMAAYNRASPSISPGSFAALSRSLARSTLWTTIVDHAGTVIYELPPQEQAHILRLALPPSAPLVPPTVP